MSFEPTEPQNGVDPNPFTLIDPDTIPYPLTDVWSLNYAAQTLRTGGQDLFGGAEDMSSTWGGLQSHYTAPESETLFAAMDPVLTRGEDIQSDLATVASALEDLAEAATTARGSLNTLRIEAQSLWNANHDKKVWWLTKDEETDEWALGENVRIKDAVNTAWSTFNEAENDCASRISATFGGPAYVSPDQAGGDDVLVYGLPTDAGERDMSLGHHLSFDGVNSNINDITAWAGSEFHPSLADWGNPTGQALWDTVVTDFLWGSAVGLTSKLGFWHPDNGWRFDLSGRLDNAGAAWSDAWMDTVGLVGVHDEHGWLWEPGEGGQEGWGAGWDRWLGNAGDSIDEVWEGHTAWSTREDGVAYSNTTMAANAVMLTGGLPLKLIKIVAGAGVVSSMDTPTGSGGPDADGSGPGSGEGSGSDSSTSRGGPGTRGWPSSPLPGAGEGQRPTGERFENPLTMLNNSLLDPNQYRPPSSTPITPVPDGGGDRPSQSPSAPQPQDSGTPPNRSDEDTPRRSEEEDTEVPGGPEERPGTPTSSTDPDNDSQDNASQGSTEFPFNSGSFSDESSQRGFSNPESGRWSNAGALTNSGVPLGTRFSVDITGLGAGGDFNVSVGRGDAFASGSVVPEVENLPGGESVREQGALESNDQYGSDIGGNEVPLDGQDGRSENPDSRSDHLGLDNWSDLPVEISDKMPPDIAAEIRESVNLVAQVHQFPEGMETIVFEYRKLEPGRMGRYDPRERMIIVGAGTPNTRETLVHEIGHAIDHAVHHGRTGSPLTLASGMPSTPEMREWASVARSSPEYKDLAKATPRHYASYLRSPQELWARSYTQWIAEQTGDSRLQEDLRMQLSQPGVERYRQWREGSFQPIAAAVEAVIENDWKLR
ncbi:hypothetical protein [Nocardiopsis deserti]|uniref:hypothetical protein n=1 Tax=Nocardiopsis deserti TaxID=2605988 RepID=UPI001239046B|nr:hypothetical protein [Nocardiopsis deserti]